MIKAINGWTFPPDMPWADAARQVIRAGFQAIEPVIGSDGEITPATTEADCRRVARQIRDTGLEVASLACGLFWQTHFASPDAATRRQAGDLTLAALDRAAWLEAPTLLVVPAVVGHFARPRELVCSYADALKRAEEALQSLALEAESRGVVIAIENVWNQFLVSPVEMREFIDQINSPWVGVYFDVGNVLRYGFPQDWIDTLGHRIVRVHLKDFKLDVGTIEGFCPLGEGDVDWPAVMQALRRRRYDGPLTFEGQGDLKDISRRMDRILATA
jgi:hexulose-6-phosphate isomerase